MIKTWHLAWIIPTSVLVGLVGAKTIHFIKWGKTKQ